MRRRAAIAVGLLVALVDAVAEARPLPLLEQARRVACSSETQEAHEAVLALRAASATALGFPDEQLAPHGERLLHAGVLDIFLAALALGVRRHPELAPELKALVGSWNACAVLDAEGGTYDVIRAEGAPQRSRLVLPLPLRGQGLRAWRLLPGSVDSSVFEMLCPGEGEGASLFDFVPGPPSGPLSAAPPPPAVLPTCLAPSPLAVPPPLEPSQPTPPATSPRPQAKAPQPIQVLQPPPGTAAIVAPLVVAPEAHHWTVGTSYSQGFDGQGTLGLSSLFSPSRGLSVRVAAAYGLLRQFRPSKEARHLTLSWGVGFDGGAPGTWALQLNNWGPLDPLAPSKYLRGTGLDISYQAVLPARAAKWGSAGMKLSLPLKGAPSTTALFTVTPLPGSFVSVGVRFSPMDRQALTWTYSAGYLLVHGQQIFSLSYTHWSPTPAFQVELVKGGAVAAGVNWSL